MFLAHRQLAAPRRWRHVCSARPWASPLAALGAACGVRIRSGRIRGNAEVMAMEMFSLVGNSQRLDGGAMFGNAPRALWSRWIAPDEQNRIPLACRCLLVKDLDGRNVLFETGIGAFFEPALRERYGVVEERHVLLDALADVGL